MGSCYNLGCHDEHGSPIGDDVQIGSPKERVFDPSGDPRYDSPHSVPANITVYTECAQLTHLRFAAGYEPKATDDFVSAGEGINFQQHTLVVEVGALVCDNTVISARHFGTGSSYNQNSLPTPLDQSTTVKIAHIIDIGCQKIKDIVDRHPFIKDVIFVTSDNVIFEAISNLEKWLLEGIPSDYSTLLPIVELRFLHTNITKLEAKNVNVYVWRVEPEHIVGPYWDIKAYLDDVAGNPGSWGPCRCPNCIRAQQIRESAFAHTGREPCPCEPCSALIQKYGHLKKGEAFPFTNNAGVEAQLVMKADGPFVGGNAATA